MKTLYSRHRTISLSTTEFQSSISPLSKLARQRKEYKTGKIHQLNVRKHNQVDISNKHTRFRRKLLQGTTVWSEAGQRRAIKSAGKRASVDTSPRVDRRQQTEIHQLISPAMRALIVREGRLQLFLVARQGRGDTRGRVLAPPCGGEGIFRKGARVVLDALNCLRKLRTQRFACAPRFDMEISRSFLDFTDELNAVMNESQCAL